MKGVPMVTKKMVSNAKGFTLVELMVVVAIIGILAAVAIPNFKKYQSRSKTSEAALMLAALYSGEYSVMSTSDSFVGCLKPILISQPIKGFYVVGFQATANPGNAKESLSLNCGASSANSLPAAITGATTNEPVLGEEIIGPSTNFVWPTTLRSVNVGVYGNTVMTIREADFGGTGLWVSAATPPVAPDITPNSPAPAASTGTTTASNAASTTNANTFRAGAVGSVSLAGGVNGGLDGWTIDQDKNLKQTYIGY